MLERESNPPSQILILKGLDSQTSEENVRQAIQVVTNLPVQDIRVIKDKISGLGRGFCFVDLSTIETATEMLKTLRSQSPAFFVDGKRVYANFARGHSHSERQSQSSLASTAIAAASALQQNEKYYQSGQVDYCMSMYSVHLLCLACGSGDSTCVIPTSEFHFKIGISELYIHVCSHVNVYIRTDSGNSAYLTPGDTESTSLCQKFTIISYTFIVEH
jgi:RNA recognition motif-containing protein